MDASSERRRDQGGGKERTDLSRQELRRQNSASTAARRRKHLDGEGGDQAARSAATAPAASSRVRLDLNSPEFQDIFFRLELGELRQVVSSLARLCALDWNNLYRHSGYPRA